MRKRCGSARQVVGVCAVAQGYSRACALLIGKPTTLLLPWLSDWQRNLGVVGVGVQKSCRTLDWPFKLQFLFARLLAFVVVCKQRLSHPCQIWGQFQAVPLDYLIRASCLPYFPELFCSFATPPGLALIGARAAVRICFFARSLELTPASNVLLCFSSQATASKVDLKRWQTAQL